MQRLKFSVLCKVRQCSQCQENTEFYCYTCEHDLCLHCKEKHVIDLDTMYHQILIYREKYVNSLKRESCLKHPGEKYEYYCHSCTIPKCVKCKEQNKECKLLFFLPKWMRKSECEMQDIRDAYYMNRRQYRNIIHNIRRITLYKCCLFFTKFKADIKTSHTKIAKQQPQMIRKAQNLMNLIDKVVFEEINDLKFACNKGFYRFREQKRILKKYVHYLESYALKSEHSDTRTSVNFILFFKKHRASGIKNFRLKLSALSEKIDLEDVVRILNNIQIIGKKVRYNGLTMSSTELHGSLTVKSVSGVRNISCVRSDRIWISDWNNLFLINKEGDILHHRSDIKQFREEVHTTDVKGNLIFLDKDLNIKRLSKDNRSVSTIIKKMEIWRPRCIYCSPCNGDLLVGMVNAFTTVARISRYNDKGQSIQIMQYINYQKMNSDPVYITENKNGDVIVSDSVSNVLIVTERGGGFRFSYTGAQPENTHDLSDYPYKKAPRDLKFKFSPESIRKNPREEENTFTNSGGKPELSIEDTPSHLGLGKNSFHIGIHSKGLPILRCEFTKKKVLRPQGGGMRVLECKPIPEMPFIPQGICTDAFANILVCDGFTGRVHMLDKNGHFLCIVKGIDGTCISYDDKTYIVWVGSSGDNRVDAYRYIKRQESL